MFKIAFTFSFTLALCSCVDDPTFVSSALFEVKSNDWCKTESISKSKQQGIQLSLSLAPGMYKLEGAKTNTMLLVGDLNADDLEILTFENYEDRWATNDKGFCSGVSSREITKAAEFILRNDPSDSIVLGGLNVNTQVGTNISIAQWPSQVAFAEFASFLPERLSQELDLGLDINFVPCNAGKCPGGIRPKPKNLKGGVGGFGF